MSNLSNNILKIYVEKLKYFNYSDHTIRDYSHYFKKFIDHVGKYPQHLTAKDFENYLLSYPFSSVSQQNQVINALKFGYEKVLNKRYNKIDFKRPRTEKHLPQVIDKDYLIGQISKISNLKHKSIISLAYSVGLRVSEICNLKIQDIDSDRMIINIIQAKGKKDRIVPLSPNILDLLRQYFKLYRPNTYLFNGQNSLKYSHTSCNKLVKKYIGTKYHFHQLRHSSFTSLLEAGTDLRIIQKIAGHKSSKTTEIYTHVSNQVLSKVSLPI